MSSPRWSFAGVAALCGFFALSASAQQPPGPQLDASLPYYEVTQGVSGSIKTVGSDSMNNLVALWGEGFRRLYPSVRVEIEGKGSGTAPAALVAGTATFGPMSRDMRPQEIDAFRKRFGYEPVALASSIDMLAVYVHRDNPIKGLTLQQIDAIFSSTLRGGLSDIRTWGQAGLTGEWADKPISLYGRNAASGTYGFFKENALFRGDYKDTVKEQPGSSAVVQGVATDRYGIGYSGIGYRTADVRVVPLALDPRSPMVPAEAEYAYRGEYPLARFLYVYINHRPGGQLDPVRREFLRYMFSREGQADVVKSGYLPLSGLVAREHAAKVGIDLPLRPVKK